MKVFGYSIILNFITHSKSTLYGYSIIYNFLTKSLFAMK